MPEPAPPVADDRLAIAPAFLPPSPSYASGQLVPTSAIVLMEETSHKSFWSIDLRTEAKRQLTGFGPEFVTTDFDVITDGGEIVFGRQKENSDIILIDLPVR